MSKINTTKVYVIRDSVSGELLRFSSKCGWCSPMAAKNAFNLAMYSYYDLDYFGDRKGLFDKQDQFTIEEIT
jgi:hypothetical protein